MTYDLPRFDAHGLKVGDEQIAAYRRPEPLTELERLRTDVRQLSGLLVERTRELEQARRVVRALADEHDLRGVK